MSHFKKTLLGAVVSSLMMSGAAFAEGANGC